MFLDILNEGHGKNLERLEGELHIRSCRLKLKRLAVRQEHDAADPAARRYIYAHLGPHRQGRSDGLHVEEPGQQTALLLLVEERHLYGWVGIELKSPGCGKSASQ